MIYLEEMIKVKTPSPNQEAIDLRKKLLKMENRASKLRIEINDVREKMFLTCVHPDVERKDSYIDGSYYDQCVYVHKYFCKFCGKLIDEERILGGFG